MAVTRRTFVRTLGIGGAAFAAPSWVSARGREALTGEGLDGDALLTPAPARASIRLSSNENPNGPARAALAAMRDAFDEASRYPGATAADAQAAIARHHGVPEDHVLLGCGSAEILRMSTLAAVGPGRALLTASPTFEDPVRYARAAGVEVVEVPVDSKLRIDLDALVRRASAAGLVFFCNPNNPTGTVFGAGDVKSFVASVTSGSTATILIDEAYHEYVDDPSYATAIPLALDNPRVIVARTFSKVYGLAGIRLGYAIGRPEALAPLRRLRLGNAVNVLASAAGIASLTASGHVERERALNREAREMTRRAFDALGYPSEPSHTNFVMVDIRRPAQGFIDACRNHGVQVGRLFPPLPTHARVSIGTRAEMTRALNVFRTVLADKGSGLVDH
jgi:histidinol-phosphate aminotransferase